MTLSYNKLWKLLIDKGMTKTEMRLKADISTTTLAKLGKNETVSMEVLLRICKVLDCNVGDIMDLCYSAPSARRGKEDYGHQPPRHLLSHQ